MPTLSKTYGATIVTSTQTVQYAGTDVNSFFGGHRIAMLAFGAPSSLGTDEQVSSAMLRCWVKADTTAGYDNITIGLIAGWSGGNTGYLGMYAACSGPTVTAPLAAGLSEAEVSIPIAGLLQAWAANPTAYGGIYLACATLPMTRIGATNCSIEYETITLGAPGAPTSISLSGVVCETPPTFTWSGASGGTNNALAGYSLGFADSQDGINWGSWQHLITLVTTETSGSMAIPLPASRGTFRKVRICTNGAAGISSAWVEAGPFRYNSAPPAPIINHPGHNGYSFNPKTRLLITIGNEADDQLVELYATEGYPPLKISSMGAYRSGRKLIVQRSDAGEYGPVQLALYVVDELHVASGNAVRELGALRPWQFFPDYPIEAGQQRVKAVHIEKLREAVQAMRFSYGIEPADWLTETPVAGTTPLSAWKGHVEEIRTAIDPIITKINSWDPEAEDCLVEAPEWIPITGTQPRADVMQQLHQVLESL